jgi:hypothetical protein
MQNRNRRKLRRTGAPELPRVFGRAIENRRFGMDTNLTNNDGFDLPCCAKVREIRVSLKAVYQVPA